MHRHCAHIVAVQWARARKRQQTTMVERWSMENEIRNNFMKIASEHFHITLCTRFFLSLLRFLECASQLAWMVRMNANEQRSNTCKMWPGRACKQVILLDSAVSPRERDINLLINSETFKIRSLKWIRWWNQVRIGQFCCHQDQSTVSIDWQSWSSN